MQMNDDYPGCDTCEESLMREAERNGKESFSNVEKDLNKNHINKTRFKGSIKSRKAINHTRRLQNWKEIMRGEA
jgi:hypothetical protein